MRFIDNMADAIRHGIRSFLQIDEAPGNIIHIQESLDLIQRQQKKEYGTVARQMNFRSSIRLLMATI